jgi:hypothetical protein
MGVGIGLLHGKPSLTHVGFMVSVDQMVCVLMIISLAGDALEEIINIANQNSIYKDKKGWRGDGFLFKANGSGRSGSDHIEFG